MKNITKAINAIAQAEPLPGRTRAEAAHLGFSPAYLDFATMVTYPSRHADGSRAPMHEADGLPNEVVIIRSPCGRAIAIKSSLIAGYERNGFFFTRANMERAIAEWLPLAR